MEIDIRTTVLGAECDRVQLVAQRDGECVAIEFAAQCRDIYRSAVLSKRHHASRGLYRRRFIESYLSFKAIANRSIAY